ncbi:MAG: DNA/RNA nuclease SfsA [Clostridiales bacterium]|nr:DNA/RNA nuclease SfsA [Eubacteriales bacterium]MDH7566658.1 DNA/RNA nuclease SfsA [Clostridiales bacterium]
MRYGLIKKANFISRPNRFTAHVLLDGREEMVHVRNTGRCREILKEGTPVILEASKNPLRKTGYSLISAYKGDRLINIDSQVPNAVVQEALKASQINEFGSLQAVLREVTYGNSRFDLYFEDKEKKGFIEVKGVTLEVDGTAMFPDAPTERGAKHVMEMVKAVEGGFLGYILFLIQMDGVHCFTPNRKMDGRFASALCYAEERGVKILAYDSHVTENEITIGSPVKVIL